MPAGSIYNGVTIDVPAADATVVAGSPVLVGSLKGIAQIDATNDLPRNDSGEYQTTVALKGEFKVPVAGTIVVGGLVYTGTAASAGEAVLASLTMTEGTDSKAVFGAVTAIAQEAGYAFVTPIQGNMIGASA